MQSIRSKVASPRRAAALTACFLVALALFAHTGLNASSHALASENSSTSAESHAQTPRNVWRLNLTAHPDGVGAGGIPCPGCDGAVTSADRMLAAGKPLPDVRVMVTDPSDPERRLYSGTLTTSGTSTTNRAYVVLSEPPPYDIVVDAMPGEGYYLLCPNSKQRLHVRQADFDYYSGTRSGRGRTFGYEWRYLPPCGEDLGSVICSVVCWLVAIGGDPIGDPECDTSDCG